MLPTILLDGYSEDEKRFAEMEPAEEKYFLSAEEGWKSPKLKFGRDRSWLFYKEKLVFGRFSVSSTNRPPLLSEKEEKEGGTRILR